MKLTVQTMTIRRDCGVLPKMLEPIVDKTWVSVEDYENLMELYNKQEELYRTCQQEVQVRKLADACGLNLNKLLAAAKREDKYTEQDIREHIIDPLKAIGRLWEILG